MIDESDALAPMSIQSGGVDFELNRYVARNLENCLGYFFNFQQGLLLLSFVIRILFTLSLLFFFFFVCFLLFFGADGNAVIYHYGDVVWSTGTQHINDGRMYFTAVSQFLAAKKALQKTTDFCFVVVDQRGQLVIRTSTGTKWESSTQLGLPYRPPFTLT
jgi:hypothetical protein